MKAAVIIAELQKLSNPDKAETLKRFFKSGKGEYAEGDKFLGLTVPLTRQIAKKHIHLSFDEIHLLLQSEYHEVRMCAALIMVEQFSKTKTEDERDILVQFYLKHTHRLNNWDLVDLSCYKILGKHLENKSDRSILYTLANSGNLWSERTAIVSTYTFIRNQDYKDIFLLAEHFINHPHDLIHKAVGWMLKETGKRNRKAENAFLDQFAKIMPRTMLRIAVEKHEQDDRKKYLQMT